MDCYQAALYKVQISVLKGVEISHDIPLQETTQFILSLALLSPRSVTTHFLVFSNKERWIMNDHLIEILVYNTTVYFLVHSPSVF